MAMRVESTELKGKLAEVDAALVNGVIIVHPRMDAPKPREFKDLRLAKDVDTSCGTWSGTSRPR